MKRRVLMVSSLWPPSVLGGAELYAHDLTGRLRDRGWDIGSVTCDVEGPDVVRAVPRFPYRVDEFESQSPARRVAFHVADLYRVRTARDLRRAIAEFDPDVIHSHAVAGLSTAALTTPSALGVAHVHTAHDYWLLCRRSTMVRADGTFCQQLCTTCSLRTKLQETLLRRHGPDIVLAISEASVEEHRRLEWASGRLRLLRHPVPRVPPYERTTGTPVVFGFLGRLTEAKGLRTLVRAFGRLDGPAGLMIAGDGPLRTEVERSAPARTELMGWLDDDGKRTFFSRIDCLVVPSELREPAGLVINEARAYGVPVIGSMVGGIPELVPSSCRTLLFPPGDTAALTERLRTFASRPAAFPVPPVDWAREGWDAHVDAVVRAYEDAVAAHEEAP